MQLIANMNYGIEPGSREDRAVGCLVGLAVGDALGSSVEFKKRGSFKPVTDMRGGGPFNLNPGEWTDDTSMALALGEALLEDPNLGPEVVMNNWTNWYTTGDYSHSGTCFDIGGQTVAAINNWLLYKELPQPSPSAGNGCIMRLAPVALSAKSKEEAVALARTQTKYTHNNVACDVYSRYLATMLWYGIQKGVFGVERELETKYAKRQEKDVSSSGYVLDTFEAACWSIQHGGSFDKAVLKAVNLGDDADTVGAVTGQIAGAAYGLSSIPAEWLSVLAWRDRIIKLGRDLYAAGAA